MAKSKRNKQIKRDKTVNEDMIFYVLYLLLALLPQYFKGGYFQNIYLPFILLIGIIMLYHIYNKYRGSKHTLVQNKGDLFLLLFAILYGLSFFYGINKRGSIIEFLKYIALFSVFIISRDLHRDKNKINTTIDILIFSGELLCIIGVGTMIGTWDYSGSFTGSRLSSTFQYPNTLAVYASLMYFLNMGRALMEDRPIRIGIYGIALNIFFSTLIFTYSRGMWLIFPVVLLIYFVILSTRKKVQLFFYTMGNLLVSLPFSFLFLRLVETESNMLWPLYIGGTLLSGVVLFGLGKARDILKKISGRAIVTTIVSLAVIGAIVLGVFINITEPVVYENSSNEDTVNRITRNIKTVFPNTDYRLNVVGEALNNREDGYAGRVVIYSGNEEGNYTSLDTFNIVETGDFNENIEISTLEDTNFLMVYFENRLADTAITFDEASITDLESGDIDEIPLKYKYIPENIVSRVLGISSSDSSLQARVIFSKDALKLAKDSPILGSGGGSWETAYRSVQSYPYWSKQVHNHFIQVLVEVGALGLILFLGVLIYIGYKYILFKRSDALNIHKLMGDTLIIACFTILAHSFIDFDFALWGYYIIFWILLGMLSSLVSEDKREINLFKLKLDKNILKKINILVSILLLITISLSGSIYVGAKYNEKAKEAELNENFDLAEKNRKKANSFDPYNKDYIQSLIDIYLIQYSNKDDPTYGNLAKEQVDKTLDISKKDPIVYIRAAHSYYRFGLIEEGLDLVNRALELQPLVIDSYIQNTSSYILVFNHYIKQGELNKAADLAREGYGLVYNSLIHANKESIRPMAKDNTLFLELNKLKYYKDNIDEFIKYYDKGWNLKYYYSMDLDVDDDGDLELINIWNSTGGELGYEIKEDHISLKNLGAEYGVLDSRGFNLEANKSYTVRFDAKGNMDMDKLTFYILDTQAEEQIQTESIKVELEADYQTYEYEFTTNDDIGEETSRIRFVIAGENEEYMDLKEMIIFEKMD